MLDSKAIDELMTLFENEPHIRWIMTDGETGSCGPSSGEAVQLLTEWGVYAAGFPSAPRITSQRNAELAERIRRVVHACHGEGSRFACVWQWADEPGIHMEFTPNWSQEAAYDDLVEVGIGMLRETLLS